MQTAPSFLIIDNSFIEPVFLYSFEEKMKIKLIDDSTIDNNYWPAASIIYRNNNLLKLKIKDIVFSYHKLISTKEKFEITNLENLLIGKWEDNNDKSINYEFKSEKRTDTKIDRLMYKYINRNIKIDGGWTIYNIEIYTILLMHLYDDEPETTQPVLIILDKLKENEFHGYYFNKFGNIVHLDLNKYIN